MSQRCHLHLPVQLNICICGKGVFTPQPITFWTILIPQKDSSKPNPRTFWNCVCGEMFLDCQTAISMRGVSGLACADFTPLTRFCSTSGSLGSGRNDQERPSRYSSYWQGLLETGVAELRSILPVRCRHQSDAPRGPAGCVQVRIKPPSLPNGKFAKLEYEWRRVHSSPP